MSKTLTAILTTVSVCTFAASLSIRALDPVLLQIAGDFTVNIQTAAMLSSAFAFTYAAVQPAMGATADMLGKTRLITFCLAVLVGGMVLGALAPSFQMLMVSRIVCGASAGGVFPIALAFTGDLVPVQERQVAIGRLIGAAMGGNLCGAAVGGVIGEYGNWRGVFMVLAAVVLASFIAALLVFRGLKRPDTPKPDLRTLKAGYASIFANPNAMICFSAVCIEGILIFGLLPFIAALLAGWGEPRLSIAGIVIGGFAFGGVIYSVIVARLLPLLGERGMMIGGGVVMAAQLAAVAFGLSWPVMLMLFVLLGIGFYMLHGSIQLYATELSTQARASAVALHAFSFFVGHALGPVAYGFSLPHLGTVATLLGAAIAVALLGLACALLLRPRVAEPV
ncbi:MAG: MFS transporter [Xanthobacteraceae bacterium]|nr:MAG: MFS transporter [Xanthobacteraceae bacterium]